LRRLFLSFEQRLATLEAKDQAEEPIAPEERQHTVAFARSLREPTDYGSRQEHMAPLEAIASPFRIYLHEQHLAGRT
jgi:hypothetical protein